MERTIGARAQLTAALTAGLAGAVLMEAFVRECDALLGLHSDQLPLVHGYLASMFAATGSTGIAALVFVLHLAVGAGWAAGYVSASRTSPQLLSKPWLSGAAFGLIVYIFMQIILLTAGLYHRPNFDVLVVQMAGHIVFFGIPVAVIAARLLRRS